MKRVMVVACLFMVLAFCSQTFAQEALWTAEGAGTFQLNERYFASGTADGVRYETEKVGAMSGTGVFAQIGQYMNGAGAFTSQQTISMTSGSVNTETRVGVTTLRLFTTEGEANITNGILVQDAAGSRVGFTGAGITETIASTAGGLVYATTTQGIFDRVNIAAGAMRIQTEGSGPTDGGEGTRVSATTVFSKQYYAAASRFVSPIPMSFQAKFSFNPAVSVLPPVVQR